LEIKMAQVHIPTEHESDPLGYTLSTYAPEIGTAAGAYATAVYQSAQLSQRIIEAARYRTALINGCMVCQSFRAARHLDDYLSSVGGDASRSVVARGGAAPDEAFYAAVLDWRHSPLFDARERLAIEYAERMGLEPQGFAGDDVFWSALHAAYSDAEIVSLTLAIGAWIALGRVTHILELDTVCMETSLAAE
jgi:alkylhydroperoxidase family enzyme